MIFGLQGYGLQNKLGMIRFTTSVMVPGEFRRKKEMKNDNEIQPIFDGELSEKDGFLPTFDQVKNVGNFNTVLLLDTSYSMACLADGKRKIDSLRAAVTNLPISLRRFHFGCVCEECGNTIPEPEGGTAMVPALKKVKQSGANHVIIVTDGQPNETYGAVIEEARGLIIDAIFIGSHDDIFAKDFLKNLTMATGGRYAENNMDVQGSRELENNIVRLLEEK